MSSEPSWLTHARRDIGKKEIPGPTHNPFVVALWTAARVPMKVTDDETPWCAAWVSAKLEDAGILSTRSGWARSYATWGQGLRAPCVGAIVVFSRGPTFGHVGFVVGRTRAGNLAVLGGNQSNMVNIAAFGLDRVIAYRWPADVPIPERRGLSSLPVIDIEGLSTNEA